MNRIVKQTPVNDHEHRYEVHVEGDHCSQGTYGYRYQQLEMLRLLAGTPGLTDCGAVPFQTLKMVHDGEKWIATLEAVGP